MAGTPCPTRAGGDTPPTLALRGGDTPLTPGASRPFVVTFKKVTKVTKVTEI
jgi:hypothetical protein